MRVLLALGPDARWAPVAVGGVREVVARDVFCRGFYRRPQALRYTLIAAVLAYRLVRTTCLAPELIGLLVAWHVVFGLHALQVCRLWCVFSRLRGFVVLIFSVSFVNSSSYPRQGITADVELRSYWRDP